MSLDLEKIAQSLRIADLAITYHHAKNEAANAKSAYHLAWKRFESGDDEPWDDDETAPYIYHEDRISMGHSQFDELCEATKFQREAYKAKVRAAYNVKRRLETAIRGMK